MAETLTQSAAQAAGNLKKFSLDFDSGVSLLTYQQTGIEDYSATNLQLRLRSSLRPFSKLMRLVFSADVASNFINISSSLSTATQTTSGGVATIGYQFGPKSGRWLLGLHSGMAAQLSSVTANQFGYSFLAYPMMTANFVLNLNGRHSIELYGRYGMLSETGLDLFGNETEVTYGGQWSFQLSKKLVLSAYTELSTLQFTSGSIIEINQRSISFGLGLGF